VSHVATVRQSHAACRLVDFAEFVCGPAPLLQFIGRALKSLVSGDVGQAPEGVHQRKTTMFGVNCSFRWTTTISPYRVASSGNVTEGLEVFLVRFLISPTEIVPPSHG
jgi:hypothetical protein